ncbi:MAG: hypothetical protein PHY33_07015 [Methanobacteriaceae archaeon]|nr:hypothetical protein [Methanobacteriaceae archaeon]
MMESKNFNLKICPECKSLDLEEYKGETICKTCGLVLTGSNDYVGGVKIDYPYGLSIK